MKKLKKPFLLTWTLLLLLQGIIFLLPVKAIAATTGIWESRSTIKIGQTIYFDSETDVKSYRYERQDDPDTGTDCIDKINSIQNDNTSGTFVVSTPNPANDENCIEKSEPITLSSPEKSYIFFVWNDEITIATSDQQNTYTRKPDKLFYEDGGDNCKDTIESTGKTTGKLIVRTSGVNTSFKDPAYRDGPNAINLGSPKGKDGCKVYEPVTIAITSEENATAAAGSTKPPGSTPRTSTADSCQDSGNLSWIICPVIKMLDGGINFLDKEISNLLEVKPREPQDLANIRAAEQRIRNFAYIILIPIMLVMVVSTALGFEFVSAYTVKKSLPRLVVAVIFIALSGQITQFLIDFTNALGAGISGLLLQPFLGTSANSLASIISPTGGAAVSGVVIFGALITGAVLGTALIGIVLSYALVTFVTLFSAFAILAVRQVFIIVLALLAPLAILAWIFPGNDKLWKLWWSSFSKLLLMYPLIMLLVTSGKVFANFVRAGQPDGILATLLVVTAYIAPYFFIPAAFKFAGGAFGTLAGMANNRSKGLFDRQKAFRGQKAGKGWQDFKSGTGSRGIRAYASKNVGRRVGAGWQGRYGLGKTGKVAMGNQAFIEPEQLAKENENFGKRFTDEETMGALSMGNDVDKMMQLKHYQDMAKKDGIGAVEAIAARGRSVGNGTIRERVAASKALARSGKIIRDDEDVQHLIASASGGDQSLGNDLKGSLQYTWRGVGRNDIGRDKASSSLTEMGVQEVGKLKPLGSAGLFGDTNKLVNNFRTGEGFADGIAADHPNREALIAARKQHAMKVVLAAADSSYDNPDQAAYAKVAAEALRSDTSLSAMFGEAEREYRREGGGEGDDRRRRGGGDDPAPSGPTPP